MCGIAGFYQFEGKRPDKTLLRAMCDVITHRGPDEEGFYLDRHVGLGIRRLKIIDLATGQQPIHNEDKSIWTVFNGEIYNFRELREKLQSKGHRFYTNVDTEVIVHLYEEYGEDFVEKLNGMFGIAVWDRNLEKLILVRDRLGIKPLSYFLTDEKLVFGSEIKSLLIEGSLNRSISVSSLDYYLTFGYVPAPHSIFEGVRKLPPGHLLTYQKGKVHIRQYWDVPLNAESKAYSEDYYKEGLFDLLKTAVRRRLISDVPLGAFLSGGVDSGTIVGLMAQLMTQPVKTFSIGFEEEEFSELDDARIVARHFGTEHTEFVVKPNALELLPKLATSYDEPFADSSAIPTFYVSQLARQHVTVALSGDGGDELFGGYRRYVTDARDNFLEVLPSWIRTSLLGGISKQMPMFMRGKSYLHYMSQSVERQYLQRVSFFSPEIKSHLYSNDLKRHLGGADPVKWAKDFMDNVNGAALLPKMLYSDLKTYLPYDLLTKVDIASMAHSLEVRVPFLDHEVVEFAAQIPPQLKIQGDTSKYILKMAMKGLVPPEVLQKKKQGFAVPLARWFRSELKEFTYDNLTSTRFKSRGWFAQDAIEKMLARHQAGTADYSSIIWSLIFFETWSDTFLDSKVHSEPSAMPAL